MPNDNYDPPLSQAGFMDLVCTLQILLKTPESIKTFESMSQPQRNAALQLETAAKNYVDLVEGR